MKNLIRKNSSLIAVQFSMLGLALLVTFSFSFVGKGFANEASANPTYFTLEGVPAALTEAEEQKLLENINTNGVIEVVEMPMTIRILNQQGQMEYEFSGQDAIQRNENKINALLNESDFLFESANVHHYVLSK